MLPLERAKNERMKKPTASIGLSKSCEDYRQRGGGLH